MIESVDLVMTALTAGATAGLTDTASTAVKDAYEGLKARALRAMRNDETKNIGHDDLLVEQLASPREFEDQLREYLIAVNAGTDGELVAAARRVLELVDPAGMSTGKYRVEVHDSQGVQVGDGNSMTIKFEK